MDMSGWTLLSHQVVVYTSMSKEFVCTLSQLLKRASTVGLAPLPADATNYQYAMNGVYALDVPVFSFIQDLAETH